ncbi:MAG: peroxiredoxin [Alphaproteobacteria bacterium]|nr:peroxiredoxin [Alphaproteobacteria bacterium]|tara:strand:+ start:895 stop:1365 length:471 start_codon:yes stop_codon:yes gene_type:complete
MAKEHRYTATVTWTGNQGGGTTDYKAYTRDYDIGCAGKPLIQGSADPGYLGDAGRHNPEDMQLASLSACRMLWYLHLCATNKVVVTAYEDAAEGVMQTNPDGSGEFKRVPLKPRITITPDSDAATSESLHEKANAMCFIARSVNFPVEHAAEITSG